MYFLFLFAITCAFSLHACDNNTAGKLLHCTLKHDFINKRDNTGGNKKTTFVSKQSYEVHFNRYHKQHFIEQLNALPKSGGDRLNFKLKYVEYIQKDPQEDAAASPVLTPAGSPLVQIAHESNRHKKLKTIMQEPSKNSFYPEHIVQMNTKEKEAAIVLSTHFLAALVTSKDL